MFPDQAMTKEEFCDYWLNRDNGRSNFDDLQEHLAESEAQYQSEVAMFGDAGPGQGLQVADLKREVASVTARLKQFGVIR